MITNTTKHTTNVTPIKAGELFERTYIVPLYQREYAWGREEIWQLLDDLRYAFTTDPNRNYHLGSITAFLRRGADGGGEYELIDGQQRVITLGLLLRVLADAPTGLAGRLRFENRQEAEAFLAAFDAAPDAVPAVPKAFRVAVDAMRGHEVFGEEFSEKLVGFAGFVRTRVLLFRVEMPPETDVSAYFEIMNNRGRQLEFADLVKARLEEKLGGGADKGLFDRLWTACSNMDGYLAHRLDEGTVAALEAHRQWWQLDGEASKIREVMSVDTESKSIVSDFPNFLLHVLRVFLTKMRENEEEKEFPFAPVSLDERQMRKEFKTHYDSIKAEDFLDVLLQTRLRFDRYVIKAEGGADGGESRWSIVGNDTWTATAKERLMHLQAMLQVTYRRNKEWLSLVLCQASIEDAPRLITLLEGFTRDRLKKRGPMENWTCAGTATPHLALNLVDYLMYCQNPEEYRGKKTFRFAFRNTVEHHFPKGSSATDGWGDGKVDDIGNLYLLSRSDNSALNVRSPKEKVGQAGDRHDFPPKRREMYRLTREGEGWTPSVMQKHSEMVCGLLTGFLNQ